LQNPCPLHGSPVVALAGHFEALKLTSPGLAQSPPSYWHSETLHGKLQTPLPMTLRFQQPLLMHATASGLLISSHSLKVQLGSNMVRGSTPDPDPDPEPEEGQDPEPEEGQDPEPEDGQDPEPEDGQDPEPEDGSLHGIQ